MTPPAGARKGLPYKAAVGAGKGLPYKAYAVPLRPPGRTSTPRVLSIQNPGPKPQRPLGEVAERLNPQALKDQPEGTPGCLNPPTALASP